MTELEMKEILAGEFNIEIPNFEKWNPPLRHGKSNNGWFKLSVYFYHDPKLRKLTLAEKGLWLILLATYAQRSTNLHGTSMKLLGNLCGTSGGPLRNLILNLLKSRLIKVEKCALEEKRIEKNRIEKRRQETAPTEPTRTPDEISPKKEKEKDPAPDLLPIWNENRGTLSEAISLSEGRKRAWKSRWRDKPDPEYWKQVVVRMSKSAFCRGEVNGWKASIDFLLRPETHIKVMEGQYDGSRATVNKATGNQALWDKVDRGEV